MRNYKSKSTNSYKKGSQNSIDVGYKKNVRQHQKLAC